MRRPWGRSVFVVCEEGQPEKGSKGNVTGEMESRAERLEERSGGGQSKAEKKGRRERHREEGGKADHRRPEGHCKYEGFSCW